jgi:hypothetical protein
MVLAAQGLRFSERHLRNLCQCQPMVGTLSSNIVRVARELGFAESIEERSLRLFDLRDAERQGLFPIVV